MTTPKIVMPELAVGQAGKEITHNEALAILDQLVQARVVDKDLATPPGSPANGAAYIVASSPTGAWVGHTNHIAYWLTAVGVWQFLIPAAGWRVWVTDESKYYEFSGSAWAQSAAFTGGTLTSAINEAPIVTIASAATVNIGAAAANTISISGTTTITAFDTIASGALRRLHFQGALTLTHNGTSLILPTAANITTAAGDMAEFVSLGSGNWRCIGYERSDGTTPALGPTSDPTFDTLTLTSGQIVFPATQVPSANANTLDDYEEGTWTPALTFVTPGDLSVTYAFQTGLYTKIGRQITASFIVETSSFTHSTASGQLRLTGLPFVSNASAAFSGSGEVGYTGITKAGYTSHIASVLQNSTSMQLISSGSAQPFSNVEATDMPSGGLPRFDCTAVYIQ